eukprot:jgi/Mesvir1/11082/Mv09872-RA.1
MHIVTMCKAAVVSRLTNSSRCLLALLAGCLAITFVFQVMDVTPEVASAGMISSLTFPSLASHEVELIKKNFPALGLNDGHAAGASAAAPDLVDIDTSRSRLPWPAGYRIGLGEDAEGGQSTKMQAGDVSKDPRRGLIARVLIQETLQLDPSFGSSGGGTTLTVLGKFTRPGPGGPYDDYSFYGFFMEGLGDDSLPLEPVCRFQQKDINGAVLGISTSAAITFAADFVTCVTPQALDGSVTLDVSVSVDAGVTFGTIFAVFTYDGFPPPLPPPPTPLPPPVSPPAAPPSPPPVGETLQLSPSSGPSIGGTTMTVLGKFTRSGPNTNDDYAFYGFFMEGLGDDSLPLEPVCRFQQKDINGAVLGISKVPAITFAADFVTCFTPQALDGSVTLDVSVSVDAGVTFGTIFAVFTYDGFPPPLPPPPTPLPPPVSPPAAPPSPPPVGETLQLSPSSGPSIGGTTMTVLGKFTRFPSAVATSSHSSTPIATSSHSSTSTVITPGCPPGPTTGWGDTSVGPLLRTQHRGHHADRTGQIYPVGA